MSHCGVFIGGCGTQARAACRPGLSVLELLGCLIAVFGGLLLGAICLGINLQGLAYTALEDADLLHKLPERCRPEPPKGHPATFSEDELAAKLKREMAALRKEITALRESTSTQSHKQATISSDPNEPAAEQTLAYWNHLREIAVDEAALQSGAQSARNDSNLDQVFALQARVSRFAAKAVEATPDRRVDPEARSLGDQLAQWFQRSGKLYDEGAHLWSNRNAQQSSAQIADRWATSERQLANEAELLANKATAIGASLSRRYKRPFPTFGH